ncbi:uncharacterized protein [Rutidosis leptorrhynchoides]|uniref:uncharacterized protein n=1 Tax=Rutidosis leptorrhynchoides TaxID=125765 RepID=UPI003A99D668
MESNGNLSPIAPIIFDRENYEIWAIRMEAHLDALDLWEAVVEDYDVPPLPGNPTMAQIKNHNGRRTRKSKAKACLFVAVSNTIFTRIMTLKTAKEIWEYLKKEYTGDERVRGMKSLNLIREFELQKMKESETAKEYAERLLDIANKVRLLKVSFDDSRIVQKILVTVPEKYEASITTLENTRDLSEITLVELLNALRAQEQRRSMRQEGFVEGALPVKHQNTKKFDKGKNFQKAASSGEHSAGNQNRKGDGNSKGNYPPCKHYGKLGHPPIKCWRRPDAKCKKCNQLGHEAIICTKIYRNKKQEADAPVADQDEGDQIFVASCFSAK